MPRSSVRGPIDRVLERIQEGVDAFDNFWNKVYNDDNVNQRERFEADLKKEMKKLQQWRDKINIWIESTEIKDKRALMHARKQIEREMERFKFRERGKKTKTFSNEALGHKQKIDPKEVAKAETRHWINNVVSDLEHQNDNFEAEVEGLSIKKGDLRPPRVEDFDEFSDIEDLYYGLPMEKLEEHEDMFSLASLSRVETVELNILERIIEGSEEPSLLDFSLLQSITEYFSEKKRIGYGGCGDVYKGILRNGAVAVKKLFQSKTIKDKMFHREVKSLIITRHENIVRFLGYCSFTVEHAMQFQGQTIMANIRERLLCFEYMSNRSLDSHLTDELRGLEWDTRYEIIMGICKGLHYLHNEKDIIHMDLKPSNILLDDKMVPKITDFGLSRIDNNSETSTTLHISPGYCAPEYILEGESSRKSDIYSLGVTIQELVTGSKKKPDHKVRALIDVNDVLRRWRHRWIKSSKNTPLSYQQVTKCLELAQRCTQHDPTGRPDISDIIDQLVKIDSKDDQCNVIPCLEDMIGIEPLEIHIPFEHDQEISHSIELTNDTDDYIAFITKTTILRLSTEPDRGIVPPRSKCSVTVTIQALAHALPNNHCLEEIITVLSTRVDGGFASMDISGDMFSEKEGKMVDEVNVMVVFSTPPLAEEP